MTDNPLADVEAEHGFTFGTPDDHETANAPSDKTLICSNKDCPAQNRQVPLHADTVLPVYCGACGQVLHCDHEWVTDITTTGTLAAPLQHVQNVCPLCGTRQPADITPLPPIDIAQLPISVVAALLNSPAQ